MQVDIILEPFSRTLHGLSGAVVDGDYAAAGRGLMDAMWREIWDRELPHKGINHWLYDGENRLFVGVELQADPGEGTILEGRDVLLTRYAYWQHVGAYSDLPEVYERLYTALRAKALEPGRPIVEIYGHWTAEESELVTEVLINLA